MFVKSAFLIEVGLRDQKGQDFGPKKGSKSELWSAKSDSKTDENFRSKKKGSRVENMELKNQITDFGYPLIGSQGSLGRNISNDLTTQNRCPLSHNADGLKPGEF